MQHTLVCADDSLIVCRSVSIALMEHPFHIATCSHTSELFDFLESNAAQCVLLDVALPGLDVLSVCERLRKQWPQLALILLSSAHRKAPLEALRAMNITHFVQKPFDTVTLMEHVFAALEQPKPTPAVRSAWTPAQLPNVSAHETTVPLTRSIDAPMAQTATASLPTQAVSASSVFEHAVQAVVEPLVASSGFEINNTSPEALRHTIEQIAWEVVPKIVAASVESYLASRSGFETKHTA